eukprot:CAMPEP_0174697290 /NCGR_PEP_ID=MMETSP1094-20130205/3193_1 /TAXON_ID=156173 /ORGANISM="Chrysochromulina brevifilum, Strain UTEX LB 985" /LENGTH=719 /DNA_ID=CAMNT_0015894239 /DNA_START=15 /DNA_END=2174 /DNA_ORIENTATION=-
MAWKVAMLVAFAQVVDAMMPLATVRPPPGCGLPSAHVRPNTASPRRWPTTMSEGSTDLAVGEEIGTSYYEDKLCAPGEEGEEVEECELAGEDEFTIGILGDLHLDPRKMEDYYIGRSHFEPIFEDAQSRGVEVALVSLGDLGESKSVRPEETDELFAGTTACHELAADFLSSFGVPYEVIGGNHDLEGIDEFATDEANLEAFCRIHKKETMHFSRQIAEKTLLVGMGSTVFRAAKYTSHEVTIDDEQLAWFENLVASHPSDEGWKIFVFTHAPPIGSGLRVLQENHVVNGCCWLNHSGGKTTTKFIELVRKHRSIKAWFSGHFHLGQDYQDSITFPTIPREVGPYPNRGSCVFAQTSVMRKGTSRDTRQQSRLLRGNKDGFEICTVDHAAGGKVRLDASITYTDTNHEVGVYAHEHAELRDNDQFIKVYSPSTGDECYVDYDDDGDQVSLDPVNGCQVGEQTVAWWHMSCGRVLGVYDGRLIEYEPSTLAPLGLVVGQDELRGKRVLVVGSNAEACVVETAAYSQQQGMEGADCADVEGEEQAVLLIDDVTQAITVVQPNEDGSYWRKIVRNKMIRMKEKRRVQAAKAQGEELFKSEDVRVVSSWGPYTSIVGTAVKTGVAGLTAEAELKTKSEASPSPAAAAVLGRWSDYGAELRAAFKSVDSDGDGNITHDEVKDAIKAVDRSATDATIEAMLSRIELDADSDLSLADFCILMMFQE